MSDIVTPLGGRVTVVPPQFTQDWMKRELPEGSVELVLRMADPSDLRMASIILSPENCDALANALMTRGVW